MRCLFQIVLVGLGCVCWGSAAWVQEIEPSRIMRGYGCMGVWSEGGPIQIYARPSLRASRAVFAGDLVMATVPLHLVNGFGEVVDRDGRAGWIPLRLLRPLKRRSGGQEGCRPGAMPEDALEFVKALLGSGIAAGDGDSLP